MHVVCAEEVNAARFGGGEVGGPRRPDATSADLDHLADVAHLRGAAHRRRQTPPLALHLVAPVDVRIDLHDRHWTVIRRTPAAPGSESNRRHRARPARRRPPAPPRTCDGSRRGWLRTQSSSHGTSPRSTALGSVDQHRPTEVEVVMVSNARVRGRRDPDRGRRFLAIRTDRRVRRRARRTDHGDVGTGEIVDRRRRKTEKRSRVTGTEHRAKACHRAQLG